LRADEPRSLLRNVFTAGSELVRSELTALGPRGPHRLTITHARGTIVEYFSSSREALQRQAELEKLLMSARGAGIDVAARHKESA
jgi:hypothetical protein